MPVTCFDDPEQILGSQTCISSLSKDAHGETELRTSDTLPLTQADPEIAENQQ